MKAWYDDVDSATLQRIKAYSAFNDAISKNLMIQTMYEYREKEIKDFKKTNHELAELCIQRKKQIDRLEKVRRTERGWAGHFCCSNRCKLRRNTLLEYNGKAVVVSTVGAMYNDKGELEEIGLDRHYETMAFYADKSEYKDANVAEEIYFDSPWSLKWHNDGYIDNEVNAMHEKVVAELSEKLLKGVL